MTDSPTSDLRPAPTDDKNNLDYYLSYRVTVPHTNVDKVKELITKYADEYLIWPHRGDKKIPNEHFHIIIPTEDKKLYDRLSKNFRLHFGQNGNGFHSGKYHDNGIRDAIAYLKHDVSGNPIYSGSYWAKLIADTAAIADERDTPRVSVKRERLGENVLTISNVLKQANLQRSYYQTDNLSIIISEMCNNGWVPSRDLMTNGVPKEIYDLWDSRVQSKPRLVSWMLPHDRSEKKKEWQDTPVMSRYNN